MSRFYAPPEHIKNGTIYINGDEAHHALNVMRLKKGDEVGVFDGLGTEYICEINDIRRKSLIVKIRNERKIPTTNAFITVAQAIPKLEKMDYIIQKCAELGVSSVIPIITERTIVRIHKDKQENRCKRWEKIAKVASKQCGRSDIMQIKKISNFRDIVTSYGNSSLKIMPSLAGNRVKLKDLIKSNKGENITIFIGPEGGFSPSEVELAAKNKVNLISLGPYTLKSDTAAIVVCAILNYELC